MKTCKVLIVFLICAYSLTASAENFDSIRIDQLEKVVRMEVKARETLKAETASLKTVIEKQNAQIEKQNEVIDTLRNSIYVNSHNIQSAAEKLGLKIDETNTTLGTKADSSDLKSNTTIGGVLIALLLVLGVGVYLLLRRRIKKGSADVEVLKAKADKLNEEVLNQFSLEMAEMQKISTSMDALVKTSGNATGSAEEDHSLIKTLADRITFMEMTLYKMDPKVRGHKHLTKTISQMKDNLIANGYELVDMLGKPYNEGMKVTPSFVEDEDLAPGTQIITGIIKPQINYKGTMIQSAQITVSQNI